MPHVTRRKRGSRGSIGMQFDPIKQDPDQTDMINQGANLATGDGASTYNPLNQAFLPHRSDAPTPSEHRTRRYSENHSERPTETEPLLREMRIRPDSGNAATAATNAVSPRLVDESFFHTSFQDIGKKLKACNDTLGELHQLGVSHDVQLPELVLVGDQSAGKSSLMSGLADLDLPRSEGTCTRCPLHIRVSRNTEWSCRVWLRKEYAYRPPEHPIHERDVTEQFPFYPWHKLPSNSVREFKTMHDKGEIETVLRWAQIAILNDDKPHHLFVPGSGAVAMSTPIDKAAEETTAKFSPNVVALEIKGPGLPDLSFYDMPGIFQNPADGNDEYLVSVVRNLSMTYIQHPSAIIICSMPMNSDAENSCTFGLTRKLGALGRTIGVLTKADLLPQGGNHGQWRDIMNGMAHATGLGYFITSRPQGKTLEELASWEARFFEDRSSDSWPASLHGFTDRCGVERLKAFLSERLGEEFGKSLPNIKQKVKNHLDRIVRQLATLPELPSNVELEIQTCLNSFSDTSRTKIDGFAARINDHPANFRDCLLAIKPKFSLRDDSDIEVLEVSDGESEAGATARMAAQATPTSKRRAMMVQETPSKRPRIEQAAQGAAASPTVKPEESYGAGGLSQPPVAWTQGITLAEPYEEFTNVGRGFRTLQKVRDEIQQKMKAGMPNIIPPEVYNDLAMEAIKPWKGPTEVFLREIVINLQKDLEATLDQSLASLKKRLIYVEAKRHVRNCLKEHYGVTRKALEELYDDETERLMTFNEEALQQCIKDEENMLFRFRHEMRMRGAGFAQKPLPPWESLTEEKRMADVKRRQVEEARLKPDQFVREVKVVSYVRGYYRLAALRYADAVSQRIICRMIPAIRKQLRTYLDSKLGVQGQDARSVYEKLMEEDDATAQKRALLKGEKTKFEQALASIEALETGGSTGTGEAGDGGVSRGCLTVPIPRRGSDATMINDDQDEA